MGDARFDSAIAAADALLEPQAAAAHR